MKVACVLALLVLSACGPKIPDAETWQPEVDHSSSFVSEEKLAEHGCRFSTDTYPVLDCEVKSAVEDYYDQQLALADYSKASKSIDQSRLKGESKKTRFCYLDRQLQVLDVIEKHPHATVLPADTNKWAFYNLLLSDYPKIRVAIDWKTQTFQVDQAAPLNETDKWIIRESAGLLRDDVLVSKISNVLMGLVK